jgi:hypothetical protein
MFISLPTMTEIFDFLQEAANLSIIIMMILTLFAALSTHTTLHYLQIYASSSLS